MSNDTNRGGGSDLDIFEGLGKKSEKTPAAAPPPPPGSASHLPAAARVSPVDARKTLLGIPGPASPVPAPPNRTSSSMPASAPPPPSGSMRAASGSNPPPPPPGRKSLPNLGQPRASRPPAEPPPSAHSAATERVPTVPPPLSTRPGARPISSPPSSTAQPAAAKSANGKLDMDWDDDNEATHVYEKEKTKKAKEKEEEKNADASTEALRAPEESEPERASMDAIMAQPPRTSSQMPAAPPASPPAASPNDASLSGAFSALGLPRETTNGSVPPPSGKLRSQPPASGSMRSVPPPPPTSQKPASPSTQPMPPPPPPPPGQVTTAPMHMPVAQQHGSSPPTTKTLQSAQSAPPPAHTSAPPAAHASAPPPYNAPIPSAPPTPEGVSRAMEQTLLTRKEPSKAPVWMALFAAVMALAGLAVYFLLLARPGTLVINVADAKGAAVQNLEIFVDGQKRCESAPCIVRDVRAGVYEVKVTAKGYEPPAPRAVTVPNGRDVATDFQLVPAKAAGGTGFKVAAAHGTVKLSVDGKEVGVLPQELRDLEPGEHKLRFVADRYVPLEKTITVAKDEIVDLGTISLKVAKGKATIQLGTPGAKVYLVNGATRKEVPQFPMAIEFDPNEKWELLATKDGYDDFKEQISFDDGQAEKTFTVTLSPKGTAARAIAAAAPKDLSAPAPKAATAMVAAKDSSAAKPATKDKAAGGGEAILKINSIPASSIVLDGKPIGLTPQPHVPVSPGTHTIMFVNAEQSLKKTITVEVKAGETKAAFAKLRD